MFRNLKKRLRTLMPLFTILGVILGAMATGIVYLWKRYIYI